MRALWLTLLLPALHAQTIAPDQIRSATVRSMALLERAAASFAKAQDCFSCHHTGLPLMAFRVARERGIPVEEIAARQIAVKGLSNYLFGANSIDMAVQAQMIIDPTPDDTYALMAADAAGVKPNLLTAIYAARIANWQRPAGNWLTIDARPPQSSSLFTTTATAIRAMRLYLPPWRRAEGESRVARARQWLLRATPQTTEDAVYRLFGLSWAGARFAELEPSVKAVLSLQRPDGGWAALPNHDSDAYSTGSALAALYESGRVPATAEAYQKGMHYLLSTQAADGSWHVRTRMVSPAPISPKYFETGFPYQHDQFLSEAGTAWSSMALMYALPKAPHPASPPALPLAAPGAKPWMETAVFGSLAELKAALDGGLDPNSKTDAGTTLLMMAAADAGKVRLLLARGADATAKAKTGYTALIVASLYRGNAESLKALLQHGATARPGTGVKFNAAPLVLTAMAGAVDNAAVLLAAGADPARPMLLLGGFPTSPLLAAAEFGDLGMVKALLAAGANPKEVDPDKISVLAWSAIEDRLDIVHALTQAGASVNAVDRFGWTPLLYAAAIDSGHADMVTALLKAGADPNFRTKDGKTPLDVGKPFPYIRAALEKSSARP